MIIAKIIQKEKDEEKYNDTISSINTNSIINIIKI